MPNTPKRCGTFIQLLIVKHVKNKFAIASVIWHSVAAIRTNERTNRLRNAMIMLCEPFYYRQYFAHNFIIALIKMSYMLIRIVSCDFDHLIALKCLARYDDRIARQVQRDARSFLNNRFVMSLVFQADYIRLDVMMMIMMSTAQSFTSAIIINGYVAHKPRHQTRSSHTIYKKNH